jgi:hypothetical protein
MANPENYNLAAAITERIGKSGLGDFIKDEELYEIVNKGVEKVLFKPMKVQKTEKNGLPKTDYYGKPEYEEVPGLVLVIIRKLVEEKLEAILREILETKHTELVAAVNEQLVEKVENWTFESLVFRTFKNILQEPVQKLQTDFHNTLFGQMAILKQNNPNLR